MRSKLRANRVLLLIETSRIYGRHLIEGIGRYAREHGPWSFSFEERGVHELFTGEVNKWKVDGVISRMRDPRAAQRLEATGIPFVELHGNPASCRPHVTVDESAVASMAAEHLIHLGLKHLGFFSRRNEWWMPVRRSAFVDHLAERGYPCAVYTAPPPSSGKASSPSRTQQDLARWLKSLPKPVGILCATDLEALVLLEACRREHIAIPDQIAVMGVDNDSVICSVAWPRLTSIDLDAQRIGYEAAALLARFMQGSKQDKKAILIAPKEVVARESTDVLAIADPQVVQAVRLIRQFACKGINVAHIADHIAACRRTLERRFKACLGHTLKEEITKVRIEQAKMFLANDDSPIKRVSDLCGFGSIHYFSRAFRKATGMTPAGFRSRIRA